MPKIPRKNYKGSDKMMNILEQYKDKYVVEIDKNVYNKLQDIYYFETEGKEKILNNINENIQEIEKKGILYDVFLHENDTGYILYYKYVGSNTVYSKHSYTLNGVITWLRYLDAIK